MTNTQTQTKYSYFLVIQQNYGFGWEDNSFYPCNSKGIAKEIGHEFRTLKSGTKLFLSLHGHDLREYRLTGYPTRSILRKEINNI
jgi:hypothetical protein